jgi:hypothetical protein
MRRIRQRLSVDDERSDLLDSSESGSSRLRPSRGSTWPGEQSDLSDGSI